MKRIFILLMGIVLAVSMVSFVSAEKIISQLSLDVMKTYNSAGTLVETGADISANSAEWSNVDADIAQRFQIGSKSRITGIEIRAADYTGLKACAYIAAIAGDYGGYPDDTSLLVSIGQSASSTTNISARWKRINFNSNITLNPGYYWIYMSGEGQCKTSNYAHIGWRDNSNLALTIGLSPAAFNADNPDGYAYDSHLLTGYIPGLNIVNQTCIDALYKSTYPYGVCYNSYYSTCGAHCPCIKWNQDYTALYGYCSQCSSCKNITTSAVPTYADPTIYTGTDLQYRVWGDKCECSSGSCCDGCLNITAGTTCTTLGGDSGKCDGMARCLSSKVFGDFQDMPSSVVEGQNISGVMITFLNNGDAPWTGALNFSLRSQDPPTNNVWNLNESRLDVGETVTAAGGARSNKTFTFNLTAPGKPGIYNFSWQMYQPTIGFFGEKKFVQISLTADQEAPTMVFNQGDVSINATTNVSAIPFDVDFFDNANLKNFTMRICNATSCINDNHGISGMNYSDNWYLTSLTAAWLNQQGEGNFSVNFTVYDSSFAQNSAVSLDPFRIIKDFKAPYSLSASHYPDPQYIGMPLTIRVNADDALSGIGKITVYVDGLPQLCPTILQTSTCLLSFGKNDVKAHQYYAIAFDKSGNSNKSSTNTFTIKGASEVSCNMIGGDGCEENEFCSSPDGFVQTNDTDRCCPMACTTEQVIAKCTDQGGTIYDPLSMRCSGTNVTASDALDPNRCCIGSVSLSVSPSTLVVYWIDSSGNRLATVGAGESVKCKAIYTNGGSATFTILKDGGSLTKSNPIGLVSSVATFQQIFNDNALYTCNASIGSLSQMANLKVVTVSDTTLKTRLPGFAWMQLIISLSLIAGYYFIVNRKK